MRDHFAVGFAAEFATVRDQLVAQRLEIFDDTVVDERYGAGDVRVSIADGWRTMCRPARVRDPDRAIERILPQLSGEVFELALGPAAIKPFTGDRAHARGII